MILGVRRHQVALLLRIMPFIAPEKSLAFKGGMPRLPVDIDLTYLPVLPRAKSLGANDQGMKGIVARTRRRIVIGVNPPRIPFAERLSRRGITAISAHKSFAPFHLSQALTFVAAVR
jgi:hypothetical protein